MKAAEIQKMQTWQKGFHEIMLKEIATNTAEILELLRQSQTPEIHPVEPPAEGGGEPRQLRAGPPILPPVPEPAPVPKPKRSHKAAK